MVLLFKNVELIAEFLEHNRPWQERGLYTIGSNNFDAGKNVFLHSWSHM